MPLAATPTSQKSDNSTVRQNVSSCPKF